MRGVVFLISFMAAISSAQLDVAFMVSNHENVFQDVLDYFYADDRFDEVNFFDCYESTPDLQEFLSHDVVIAGGGARYHDPVLFGDRLADYVDQGGYVCVTVGGLAYWWSTIGIGGRWRDDGYCPYYSNVGYSLEGYEDLIIDDPGHEIFDGVSGLWNSYRRADTILRDGAVELAHFADAGGVALSAPENVAAINFIPIDVHEWTGDGYRIMANAACYLAGYPDVQETSWGVIKAIFD